MVTLLFAIGVAITPFAAVPAAHVDAFIPVLQTVACVIDLITAGLLFSQYSIRPLRVGPAIASGYCSVGCSRSRKRWLSPEPIRRTA